ncbi:colicin immunity domain-containing protein [Paenisporosarcina sp. TG20]|uniref:colicin immunity domain-containing protein n=1 Tax=Paenisporosarcina sp. TG20 TaxID=1211706 RepID=UPI00030E2DCF|nr:colicin immunity domain-containing protein [Paenisporosarcina sp. TG20]
MNVDKYKKLMVDLLEEKISADEFQAQYLKKFKESDDRMGETLFEILNGVFESTDCYWHECLPGHETSFEISEQQLKVEVNKALIKLNKRLNTR